jgi:hypothetical protein
LIAVKEKLEVKKSNLRGASHLLIALPSNFIRSRFEQWMCISRAVFALCLLLLLFGECHGDKTGMCDRGNTLNPVVTFCGCSLSWCCEAAFVSLACNSSSSSSNEWTVQQAPIGDPATCATIALANWTPWATPQIMQPASNCCGCMPRRGHRSPHIG